MKELYKPPGSCFTSRLLKSSTKTECIFFEDLLPYAIYMLKLFLQLPLIQIIWKEIHEMVLECRNLF